MSRSRDTVLIRISRDLTRTFGTRADDGRRLEIALGDPVERVNAYDPEIGYLMEPVYAPTITALDDGRVLAAKAQLSPGDLAAKSASGTETFARAKRKPRSRG
ncbi:MAG: hypothetical protein ACREMY_01180 [bacterium]